MFIYNFSARQIPKKKVNTSQHFILSATFHRTFTKTCKSLVLKNNWESQLKQIHIKGFLYILSWMNRLKTSIHNSPSINEVHWRGIMVQFFSQLIFLSPSHKKTVFSKVFQRFSIWSHWSKHWISPMYFFLPLLPPFAAAVWNQTEDWITNYNFATSTSVFLATDQQKVDERPTL